MTSKIQILDTIAANQIAAGEVVERPVSVVKELIENALDANATQIEIAIEGSGVERIRIQDNGQGIPAEDLPLAILRHATSKIRRINDLISLQTLGFRGEALPSIASVSKMEIISRPPSEIAGRLLRVEGGEQIEFTEIGCPPGTSITVDDLFFNTPARRKFLKSKNTEFGLISDVIGRLSLARPDVAFTLKHPKTLVLHTPGRGQLLESIGAVLGQTTARRLIPIAYSQGDWHLEGYISPPDLVRSTKQGETLIVNQRIIRSQSMSRAILEGYHTLIPAKLYPIIVLNLELPPHEYDVNVHPTKMEIRFHKEKELSEFIAEGIREALLEAHPVAPFARESRRSPFASTVDTSTHTSTPTSTSSSTAKPSQYAFSFISQKTNNPPIDSKDFRDSASSEVFANSATFIAPTNSAVSQNKSFGELAMTEPEPLSESPEPLSSNSELLGGDIPGKKGDTLSNVEHIKESGPDSPFNPLTCNPTVFTVSPLPISPEKLQPEDTELPSEEETPDVFTENPYIVPEELKSANPLLALRPIGQVFNTYILTTDGDQLVIFDQHAAHERINYERLLKEFRSHPGDSQMLLVPLTMEFTPGEEEALLEYILVLNEMGFILEQFGTRTYLLRGIPAYSGHYQGEKLLRNFLDQVLLNQIPPTMDQLLEEWIYLLACKESIKAKENLTLMEMEQLLGQLSKTDNPYTCPHGRPTMIQLSREELERRFYRN